MVDPNLNRRQMLSPERPTKRQHRSSKDKKSKDKRISQKKANANAILEANRRMTPNAVHKMLYAEKYEEPLVVGLALCPEALQTNNNNNNNNNNETFVVCYMFDATMYASVLIYAKDHERLVRSSSKGTNSDSENYGAISQNRNCVVRVEGYITSTVNATATTYPHFQPFLCLTQLQSLELAIDATTSTTTSSSIDGPLCSFDQPWEVLKRSRQSLHTVVPSSSSKDKSKAPETSKIPGGTSGACLQTWLDLTETSDTTTTSTPPHCGGGQDGRRLDLQPCSQQPLHEQEFDSNYGLVQDFWRHHNAMQTLQDANVILSRSRSNSMDLNRRNTTSNKTAGGGDTPPDADAAVAAALTTASNNEMTPELLQQRLQQEGESSGASPGTVPQQHQHQQKPQHELYFSALKEFSQSQIDRQKASLTSNAGKATAKVAAQVVKQHKETHDQVMMVASHRCLRTATATGTPWITLANLLYWHKTLCGNGLHPNPGAFRTNTVKAGRTVFRPAAQVLKDLQESMLPSLLRLEDRLRLNKRNAHNTPKHEHESDDGEALGCLTLGAAVFFGLVDAHPFSDGNGRLARLLGNAALRALGLPFCVNWFATSAQRREYVLATLMTRRNLTLVYRGKEMDGDGDGKRLFLRDAMAAAGMFYPLVALLMDRIRKAIPDFVQLQHDKQLSQMEHDEAKAARRVRERAAAGSCLICFDDNPNIATLCCGKAVHLNCIAEWLSNNTTCPNCRGTLPKVKSRPERNTLQQFVENQMQSAVTRAMALDDLERDNDETENDMTMDDDDGTMSDDTTEDYEEGTTSDDTEVVLDPEGRVADQERRLEAAVRNLLNTGRRLGINVDNEDGDDSSTDSTDSSSEDDSESNGEINPRGQGRGRNAEETANEDGDETTNDDDAGDVERGSDNRTDNRNGEYTSHDDTTDDTEAAHDDDPDADTSIDETTDGDPASTGSSNNNYNSGIPAVFNCDHCSNRAAQECMNSCCGRCCVLHGQWECARHRG